MKRILCMLMILAFFQTTSSNSIFATSLETESVMIAVSSSYDIQGILSLEEGSTKSFGICETACQLAWLACRSTCGDSSVGCSGCNAFYFYCLINNCGTTWGPEE